MLKVSGANRPDEWMKRRCKKCIYESICKKDQHNRKGHCKFYKATSFKGWGFGMIGCYLMKKEDPRLQGLCKECTHRNTCKEAKRYLKMTGCSEYRHWKKKPEVT